MLPRHQHRQPVGVSIFREDPMILREETIKRFGYDPDTLKSQSNRYVVVQCPLCSSIYERTRQYYNEENGCRSCAASKIGRVTGGKKPRKYQTEAEVKEAERAYQRRTNLIRFRTPKGKIISRIASNLRNALRNRRQGTFRNLPYTRDEIVSHIEECLRECDYICPMCKQADLREAYDIDHRIPLATAKTVEQVIELFSLSNLGVLCPDCNRKIKRDKILD
jgi:hypothetical protein